MKDVRSLAVAAWRLVSDRQASGNEGMKNNWQMHARPERMPQITIAVSVLSLPCALPRAVFFFRVAGDGEWADASRTRFTMFRKTPEEWGRIIHAWAYSMGITASKSNLTTFYALQRERETEGTGTWCEKRTFGRCLAFLP